MNIDFPLFWIGIRESEIADTGNLFKGSITIFGTNKKQNYSFDKEYNYRYDYNQESDDLDYYVNQKALEIIKLYPACRFLLYYPTDINILYKEILERIICINDRDLIDLLEDKINTRQWVSDIVSLPPYTVERGYNISYQRAVSRFPAYEKFVVQADYSCGGSGTWLFYDQNIDYILNQLQPDARYTISPYISDNISVNIHIIIFDNEILLLPASVQLIILNNFSFSYKGADFIAYKYLPDSVHNKVIEYSQKIGERLRYAGYRGVLGIDFIANASEVYFMEINARFQSSTFLINKALCHKNLSVQELHLNAFMHKKSDLNANFETNYSFYSYNYNKSSLHQILYIKKRYKECPFIVECTDDDLDWNMVFEENTYLFKIVCNTSISAWGPEHTLLIQNNLDIRFMILPMDKKWRNHLIELKIMLLSRGIRINHAAALILQKDGINHEEFEAIDLILENQFYINVPYLCGFSQLSPFEINVEDDKTLILTYYEKKLGTISVRPENPIGLQRTQSGLLVDDISYMGYDRLRVFHRIGCYYKECGLGCGFCDVENINSPLPIEDIKEVIDIYMDHKNVNHYLIGGGSTVSLMGYKKIIDIAQYIQKKSGKSIYLMSTPPMNIQILYNFKDAGITEVAFNLEVFDRKLAAKYMPGKGNISLKVYEAAFKSAVKLWGNTGNVRSIFIVGLEPEKSLLRGIEYVCGLGVAPILSLFKPIKGTKLDFMLPPNDKEILHTYLEAKKICDFYGLELGPECHYCEDNTIKITT